MRKCEYEHEGLCTKYPEFKCPYSSKTNDSDTLRFCNAKPEDLIEVCDDCGVRPADAEFPYNEYCKECAVKRKKEDDES